MTITRVDISGKTTLTFTFAGAGTDVGSLADGIWNLNVTASGVQMSGRPEIMLASNYRFTFHRLFGDGDSDRDVDFLDQRKYTAAVGKTDSTNLGMFDFNNDGHIDALDTTQFTSRIGKRV